MRFVRCARRRASEGLWNRRIKSRKRDFASLLCAWLLSWAKNPNPMASDANLQELLEREPSTMLQKALMDLVQSNVLPADDKVAIGTIRR